MAKKAAIKPAPGIHITTLGTPENSPETAPQAVSQPKMAPPASNAAKTADFVFVSPNKECACNCPHMCDHLWGGPLEESEDGAVQSTVCVLCGMDASDHALQVFLWVCGWDEDGE